MDGPSNLCLGDNSKVESRLAQDSGGTIGKSLNGTADNKALVRRLFDEWVNKKNLTAVDEMVSPNYVNHEGGVNNGAVETKVFLSALFNAFPDLQVTVEDMVAEGDKVVVRNTWRGTHRGPFLGIPATGKSTRIDGIVIWRVENGKVAERWATLDYLSLMRQLGVLPASPR